MFESPGYQFPSYTICHGCLKDTLEREVMVIDGENYCYKCSKEIELKAQLTAAQSRVAGHVEYIKSLEAEVAELKAIKFRRFANEDCWMYQGDGEDHLESLVCPVIVSPQKMLEFEKAQSRVAELEKALSLYSARLSDASGKETGIDSYAHGYRSGLEAARVIFDDVFKAEIGVSDECSR